MNQKKFLQQMQELVDFGRTKGNCLTKEEIADYCSDLSLTAEQLELVYAYLKEHQIQVPGYHAPSLEDEMSEDTPHTDNKTREDSKYLRMYRKELRDLPERTSEDLEELYRKLRMGNEEVIPVVVEAHLKRIVTLAGKYKGRGVPLEDLIQEGNLELMTCVTMLCGNREVVDYKKAIDHAVRSRLIELVDAELYDSDNVNTVLARVNLLLEATNILAEEYGRVATLNELAEFTHMDDEEIKMYVEFSQNKIEIGTGEIK